MKNAEILIFDLGNVIINLKPEIEWINENLYSIFSQKQLISLEQNSFFKDYEIGKISTAEFLQQLKVITVSKNISEEEIILNWNQQLLDIPRHRIELLLELKNKYQLFLLSNTNELHLSFIQTYLQMHFGANIFDAIFEKQFYSQQLGMRKPNKNCYEYVFS